MMIKTPLQLIKEKQRLGQLILDDKATKLDHESYRSMDFLITQAQIERRSENVKMKPYGIFDGHFGRANHPSDL